MGELARREKRVRQAQMARQRRVVHRGIGGEAAQSSPYSQQRLLGVLFDDGRLVRLGRLGAYRGDRDAPIVEHVPLQLFDLAVAKPVVLDRTDEPANSAMVDMRSLLHTL